MRMTDPLSTKIFKFTSVCVTVYISELTRTYIAIYQFSSRTVAKGVLTTYLMLRILIKN